MKMLTIQEAYQRKFTRQRRVAGLEYHASGHCVHIGKLSPGCYKCFVPDAFWHNFRVGSACNCVCPYCFGFDNEGPLTAEKKIALLKKAVSANLDHTIPTISFSGGGETLLHFDVIVEHLAFYRQLEKHLNTRPWYYLYTNGLLADLDMILRLKDLGFDEIRFHLGASDFAQQAYTNMRLAAQHISTITVETPAWPPHRLQLFEMLPIIEDIGVKHLNIGEIEITRHNQQQIAELQPHAEVYQAYGIHVDDGGLIYDIFEEVLKKGYTFSVLDCSSFVKQIQRAPGKWIVHEPIDGLCMI